MPHGARGRHVRQRERATARLDQRVRADVVVDDGERLADPEPQELLDAGRATVQRPRVATNLGRPDLECRLIQLGDGRARGGNRRGRDASANAASVAATKITRFISNPSSRSPARIALGAHRSVTARSHAGRDEACTPQRDVQ